MVPKLWESTEEGQKVECRDTGPLSHTFKIQCTLPPTLDSDLDFCPGDEEHGDRSEPR